jgi:hypothetical protein
MIKAFVDIEKLFQDIGLRLESDIHIFLIGGAVLLHQGLKPATKDIDAIVDGKRDFDALELCLRRMKFRAVITPLEYGRMDLSQIFVRDDFRIDLFDRTVCRGFALSESMKKRSNEVISLDKIKVSVCSNEDIFVFKTLTEREGDLDDCIALAQGGLDWDAVLAEIKGQIGVKRRPVWITWIGERLDLLVERGLNIPIMPEIDRLRKDFFDDFEQRHKSAG